MLKKIEHFILLFLIFFLFGAWIKPIYLIPEKTKSLRQDNFIFFTAFKNGYADRGYSYPYPDKTSKVYPVEISEDFAQVALTMNLDNNNYSGAAIGFSSVDLTPIRKTGFLEFYIRRVKGDGGFYFALLDSEKDGKKTEIRLNSGKFVKLSTNWQKVIVPLSMFKDNGYWWTGKNEVRVPFDWSDVVEFKIAIKPSPSPFVVEVASVDFYNPPPKKQKELPPIMPIKKDSQKNGISFGISGEDFQKNEKKLYKLESIIGKKFSTVMWYVDWDSPFPSQMCQTLYNKGYSSHIVWEPWTWKQPRKNYVDEILSGKWDAYIQSWANSIAQIHIPIMIRFAHEFNGNWYSWSLIQNHKNTEKYIQLFQYVHDLCQKNGATNIIWVWSVNNLSIPNEPWNDYLKAYPGDKYVDWVAIDGYNFGISGGAKKWLSFNNIFWETYVHVLSNIKKPIMLGEFASSSSGGDKSKWLLNMHQELKNNYPGIKAIVWYNFKRSEDWRLDENYNIALTARSIFRKPRYRTDKNSLTDLSQEFYKNYKKYVQHIKITKEKMSQKAIAIVHQKKSQIIIDGKLDDWNNIPITLTIDKSKAFGELEENWDGPKDSKADVKLLWDKNAFYIAVYVTDDVPMLNFNDNGDIWNGDAIECTLSVDPSANPKRMGYAKGDFQIGITPGYKGKNIKPFVWCWQLGKKLEAQVAVSKTKTSYIIEASIPWKNFGNFSPKMTEYGFDVALDDSDGSGRETQLVWFGSGDFYKNPSIWGMIKLTR